MNHQYEFPDDPEVFARVLEKFRNLPIAYWESRLALYTEREREQNSAQPMSNTPDIETSKSLDGTQLKPVAMTHPAKRPKKRTRRTSDQ